MTIKDIAKLSGVSVSTVSRVLNNRPDVSEVCRSRVNAVIQSSNYIPNNSARDLVKIRSDAIGLVVRGVSKLLLYRHYPFHRKKYRRGGLYHGDAPHSLL